MEKKCCVFKSFIFFLTYFLAVICSYQCYKIPDQSNKAVRNAAPMEYKGPVFLVKETTDTNEPPFVGLIVEGGIEMVKVLPPRIVGSPVVGSPASHGSSGQSTLEHSEDPEYFAVLVTPETVAQSQLSRTTTITLPLTVLLIGVSARIPWLLVLRKQNHFEYFKTLQALQMQSPLRRRGKQIHYSMETGRFSVDSKNYDLMYIDENKTSVQDICANIINEMLLLNKILQNSTSPVNCDIEGEQPEVFEFEPSNLTVPTDPLVQNSTNIQQPLYDSDNLSKPTIINASTVVGNDNNVGMDNVFNS